MDESGMVIEWQNHEGETTPHQNYDSSAFVGPFLVFFNLIVFFSTVTVESMTRMAGKKKYQNFKKKNKQGNTIK